MNQLNNNVWQNTQEEKKEKKQTTLSYSVIRDEKQQKKYGLDESAFWMNMNTVFVLLFRMHSVRFNHRTKATCTPAYGLWKLRNCASMLQKSNNQQWKSHFHYGAIEQGTNENILINFNQFIWGDGNGGRINLVKVTRGSEFLYIPTKCIYWFNKTCDQSFRTVSHIASKSRNRCQLKVLLNFILKLNWKQGGIRPIWKKKTLKKRKGATPVCFYLKRHTKHMSHDWIETYSPFHDPKWAI